MKARKIMALLLTAAMALSLVACGGSATTETTAETATEAPAEETAPAAEAETEAPAEEAAPATPSIDFEDGVFGFVGVNTKIAGGSGDFAFSVEDFAGSKALKVVPSGKVPCVGLQVDALLGENLAKVKTIEMSVGTDNAAGKFYATSGNLYALAGENNDKLNAEWSVYLETANPKTVTLTLPDGCTMVEGNTVALAMEVDNCKDKTGTPSNLYIDNITFKDADGNVLAADTAAVYEAEAAGADPNLMVLSNVTELEGFATSAAGWAQAGIDLTDEQRALLVPGSVIEIEYSADAPVWLVAIGETNPLGGWLRGVNQETFVVDGYVASDKTKVQYTYEQLVPYFGEDFGQHVTTLQCESSVDWEVFSVKIGTNAGFVNLAGATELEGFATSAAGWAQAGIDLTDEQRALLVPGSIIEIEYSAEAPVWLVAIGETNPLGGWLRGVNQETFVVDGAVNADNTKVQYTYEQLVPYFGEDFGQHVTTLQCESSVDWEVYSVKIGNGAIKPCKNATELEGFATSAAGWAQAGIDLTDEQRALLVPGCVINIQYSAEAPVWLVAIGETNPLGGWLRGVNQETFVVDGAVNADNTMVQYTYEQLVPYFGEDFGQHVTTLQCESSVDWEVYGVSIGMAE
ncbi:MAG: hypothetical protein IJD96_04510 [Lachnospiraceae bacterium]|nr:hypothetical protein [Lachnospiraceae bacterium]